jgi:hypothetical protein
MSGNFSTRNQLHGVWQHDPWLKSVLYFQCVGEERFEEVLQTTNRARGSKNMNLLITEGIVKKTVILMWVLERES